MFPTQPQLRSWQLSPDSPDAALLTSALPLSLIPLLSCDKLRVILTDNQSMSLSLVISRSLTWFNLTIFAHLALNHYFYLLGCLSWWFVQAFCFALRLNLSWYLRFFYSLHKIFIQAVCTFILPLFRCSWTVFLSDIPDRPPFQAKLNSIFPIYWLLLKDGIFFIRERSSSQAIWEVCCVFRSMLPSRACFRHCRRLRIHGLGCAGNRWNQG